MSAEKLRNIAKIPGMSDLVGSLGVELINDIADSYSDMYEVIEATLAISDLWTYPESVSPENVREAQALSIMKSRLEKARDKAKGESK